METLEQDSVAKYYLKELILKYVFTGEFPTDFKIKNNIHQDTLVQVGYENKYKLEPKPPPIEPEVITNEQNSVSIDYDNILSSLKLDRTESDEHVEPIQNE
jgi:hypothetical protein